MLTHYVITVTALQSCQDDPIFAKYKRLNEALVGVVEDYSLVSFTALSVQVSFQTNFKSSTLSLSVSSIWPEISINLGQRECL